MLFYPGVTGHATRVLIVDDEPANRLLLEIMLATEGYQLTAAGGGEEALVSIARQPPDVILLDVMQPGTDGYWVADRIKRNPATKHIPIIMMFAVQDRDAKIQALKSGAEDFLTKPVDRTELCMRVRNLSRLKTFGDHYARQAELLNLAHDAILTLDPQHRILFWSGGAAAMYGWQSEEALGRRVNDLIQAQFNESEHRMTATLLREGHWRGEATHHRRNGSRLTVSTRWALQRNADGAPLRILTISTDITERKRLQDNLEFSGRVIHSVMQHASIGIALSEPSGRWLKVNRAFCVMLGLTESELLSGDAGTISHPDDLCVELELVRNLQAGTIPSFQIEKRYRHKNGNFVWVAQSVAMVRNPEPVLEHFISQIHDLDALEHLERTDRNDDAARCEELRAALVSIRDSLGRVHRGVTGALSDQGPRLSANAYRDTGRLETSVGDFDRAAKSP